MEQVRHLLFIHAGEFGEGLQGMVDGEIEDDAAEVEDEIFNRGIALHGFQFCVFNFKYVTLQHFFKPPKGWPVRKGALSSAG